jgi:hypothetical protein
MRLEDHDVEAARLKAYTAIDARLIDRKFRRYGKWIVLAIMLGPFLGRALVTLGLGGIGSVFGLLLLAVIGLVWSAMTFLIPAAIFCAFGYVVWTYYRKPADRVAVPQLRAGAQAPQQLTAELAMVEDLRTSMAAEARWRTWLFVPLGLAAGLLVSLPFLLTDARNPDGDGSPLLFIVFLTAFGFVFGWIYAVSGPSERYASAFKSKLVPHLLRAYGELRHSIGPVPPLGRLIDLGLLPGHDKVTVDDVFSGTYRDHAVRISEMALTRKGSKSDVTVFQGVLIDVAVTTPFRGLTIAVDEADHGGSAWTEHGLMRVRLEDPVFDELYSVYGSDQVEARAVLTPAVMVRLLGMSDARGFHPPRFMTDGMRMSFAVYRIHGAGLFEPPGLESHDATEQLASLEADLAMIFGLVDAMIDMHVAVRPRPRFEPSPTSRQ